VPAFVVGVLVGAFLTTRMPMVIVVPLLLALDAVALLYWLYFRAEREASPVRSSALQSLRSLADVVRVAGALLLLTAVWVTMLGVLTQYGITNAATADWSGLAASGFRVDPDQPAAFGARSVVVAAAVWVIGFGLAKASGERV
jgi:hypothetical protein